ncbi:hypothetical protein DMN91_009945 [Ooceraea biroi]|uniref:NMDA receptor-regulated protein n=1 Tax=Ooceraea biroi TaxID=2015173 RepID=A0A026WFV3_OOCBI|nr:NMDA receptor-regulated protein [Ooceraea biroi]RLU17708.1 hypothetical protein DMN91_009945 [Ooceraea biroi]
MDRFKKIDWIPPLEDMIDTVFVRDERMKRESAMYRIMTGNFTDPFEGIEEEYEKVDIELIKRLGGVEREEQVRRELGAESSDKSSSSAENVIKEHPPKEDLPEKGPAKKTGNPSKEDPLKDEGQMPYIPGIRKLPFYFPRRSHLDKNQQAMCLRVLLRFSSNKKQITEAEKIELQKYMSLQSTISEEQTEFLDFAKNKWDATAQLFIKYPDFISCKWNRKMCRLQKLPKYYAECTTIPFSMTKDVKLEFVRCLQQESLSEIKLPQFHTREVLSVTTAMLHDRFIPSRYWMPDKKVYSVLPSEDTYCESLAIKANADLVISSSGLKCLLNNVDSTQSNSWLIPVVIKSHNGKNVIYVDKKLPPTIATVPQKNTWVYKYILRYCFAKARDQSKRAEQDKLNKSHSVRSSDSDCAHGFDEDFRIMKELLQKKKSNRSDKISPAQKESKCSDSFNDDLEIAGEDESEKAAVDSHNDDNDSTTGCLVIDESVERMSLSSAENESSYTDDDITDPEMGKGRNVSYRLFTIKAQSQDYHERRDTKQYRILVRSKLDGFVTLPDGRSSPLMLSPKMEHQLGFGAEAISLKEGLHEWASLTFRPEASLARVRIEADSGEVIQIERHTTTSLNNEIRRLHNVRTEDSLKILYNVIEKLSVLTPGRYIVRHIPRHGPFAYVYKKTDELKKKTLNLDMIYESKQFENSHITPWPPIDRILTTPWMRHSKKMPAMFNPYYPKSTEKSPQSKQATRREPQKKGKSMPLLHNYA